MTQPRGILTFCPNGYLVEGQKNVRWLDWPDKIRLEFKKLGYIWCAARGPGGNFFISWKDKDGTKYRWYELPNYPVLKTYLDEGWQEKPPRFDHESFHVSLGPDGSFYINNGSRGQHHKGLDAALGKELDRRLSDDKWPHDPKQVALGIDGSFVLVGKKGDIMWDLKGNYTGLETRLQEAAFGVKSVTLSPFKGNHWYVEFADGHAWWNVEDGWDVKRYEK